MSPPTPTHASSRLAIGLLAILVLPAAVAAQTAQDWRLTMSVSPLGGANPVDITHPTLEDRIRLVFASDELDCRYLEFRRPALVTGKTIRVEATRQTSPIEPCSLGRGARTHEYVAIEPLGESGEYTIDVYLAGELLLSQPLEVWEPSRTLHFSGFPPREWYHLEVRVMLTDPRVVSGPPREASSVRSTPETGYWWFFDPDNVEVTVKVLDGRAVDGRLWLFVTSMTDVGFTVEARSWGTCAAGRCPTHRYVNSPGGHLVVVDGIEAGQ